MEGRKGGVVQSPVPRFWSVVSKNDEREDVFMIGRVGGNG